MLLNSKYLGIMDESSVVKIALSHHLKTERNNNYSKFPTVDRLAVKN